MSSGLTRAVVSWLAVGSLSACAARQVPATGESTVPLDAFIQKVRAASSEARPSRGNVAETLEQRDAELAGARLLLAAAPTADHYRLVAELYARHGVLDAAYDHFTAALHLNARDVQALDGRARIWRDWGFPERGLGEVYRAIAIAPDAPAPRNTLGTLLVALGQPAAAGREFERALSLDPGAAYALNNLCYAAIVEGDGPRAIARCHAALDVNPDMTVARNNLALAYATAGDFAAASREFLQAGDAAAERYNMGVALFATHHYRDAAEAFDAAADLRPSLTLARQRAQQARDLAAAGDPEPKR